MVCLGLDLSTQSLSAVIIDSIEGKVLDECSINFAKSFPEYKTENGFISGKNQEFYSYPELYLDALDQIMTKLGDICSSIDAISLSGHQHASVYLNKNFTSYLSNLDSSSNLSNQLKDSFSRSIVPIWMDNSTSIECEEMNSHLEGSVSEISGSLYCERFTAAQIRKFYKISPQSYRETATIHLISSFMVSVLAGRSLPIDSSDGAGMNLMNLLESDWDEQLLKACAPDLISKLPEIKSADTKAAKICNYFKDKYGFKEECNICLASGDNPNSLIGCGASEPGTVVISMGTSDTFFGAVGFNTIDTQGIGHIFGNPAGGYMSLICFRNGSLSREIALKTTGLNWVDAEKFIAQNTPFEGENFKAFLIDEMYPKSKATLDEKTLVNYSKEKALVGLIESQILNIKCFADLHAKKIDTIRITGGASQNKAIAQIIADVFQAKVERIQISNSAALGAAMRAAHSCSDTSWATLNNKFTSAEISFLPNLENAQIYSEKIAKYKSLIF